MSNTIPTASRPASQLVVSSAPDGMGGKISPRCSTKAWHKAHLPAMPHTLKIGDVSLPGRVLTAPMTGVSDLPFRQTASEQGAPYVATEMVACDSFARGRPPVGRRGALRPAR